MMLHETNVRHHHIENVFTNCLKITFQLQFLSIQEPHTHLPLHVFRLAPFLLLKVKYNRAKVNESITIKL